MKRLSWVVAVVFAAAAVWAADAPKDDKKADAPKKAPAKGTPVYTTVEDARAAGPDIDVQGEYEGTADGKKVGIQVIGLGSSAFQAVVHNGGLPGAGWDGAEKFTVDGKLDGAKAVFAPSKAAKRYMDGKPESFSALQKNPPEQKNFTFTIEAGKLAGKTDSGAALEAKRVVRESPTLGAKPPAGAIVLFDGTSKDAWTGGRIDEKAKTLCTDGKDILTKQKFSNYTMHVEFMLPYRPDARGQGRGNSGFYQVDHYEVQILDSFGLMGLNNECGGIYTKASPKVNMCLPPLQWQTYDVEFTNAVAGTDPKMPAKPAVMTLKHNGVVIHENFEIKGKTGGSRGDPEGTPGPIKLQGHGNPLQFRNVWIVEKK